MSADDAPTKRRLVKLVVRGDGQIVLQRLLPGASLSLLLAEGADPDTPAILVATADGEPLGAIATADARVLAPFLGTDALAEVVLHHLTGGTAGHPGQEAQIGLRWQGQEARTPVPLTIAQRAWRAEGGVPVKSPSARSLREPREPGGLIDRLRQAVGAYYSGQLTWKMTFIGIVLSTITMTTILILFGDK